MDSLGQWRSDQKWVGTSDLTEENWKFSEKVKPSGPRIPYWNKVWGKKISSRLKCLHKQKFNDPPYRGSYCIHSLHQNEKNICILGSAASIHMFFRQVADKIYAGVQLLIQFEGSSPVKHMHAVSLLIHPNFSSNLMVACLHLLENSFLIHFQTVRNLAFDPVRTN